MVLVTNFIADDAAAIKAVLDEIEREKAAARKKRDEDASFEHSPFTVPVDIPDIFF